MLLSVLFFQEENSLKAIIFLHYIIFHLCFSSAYIGNSGQDHLWSVAKMNLGLPLRPGCDETHQVPLRLIVKEEDIKEEEYGHMITCQYEDLHCKTESDFTESLSSFYNEILQTTVEVKVKKEEDEQVMSTDDHVL